MGPWLNQLQYPWRGPGRDRWNPVPVLGIFIQKDIRWNKQTQHASAKATRTLNFVKRNFPHCFPSVKEKLYKNLIRPHLEYASAAWDPFTAKNILALESVQRRAARFVTNTYGRDTSVSQILNDLKWTPRKDRREAHRLTCLYKILHGPLDIRNDNEIRYKPARERRGHANQLIVNATSTDAYRHSFFPRSIRYWNELAPSTISRKTTPWSSNKPSPMTPYSLLVIDTPPSTQPSVKTPQGDVSEDYLSKIQDPRTKSKEHDIIPFKRQCFICWNQNMLYFRIST